MTFTSSGDNPTDYGADNSRTFSWSVSDGLFEHRADLDDQHYGGRRRAGGNSLVAFTGGDSVTEDTGKQITFSVTDVDADPANQDITVRLQVLNGTIDIDTAVAGGLVAGDVTGDNTNDVLLTGTQNQINATSRA